MKDQLSALIDGEFAIESAEHIITSAISGGELKEAWRHYHLIGDAMRGDCHMQHNFSMRVMQALESEPTALGINKDEAVEQVLSKKQAYKISLFKGTKAWSIAASVAAVMFVGLMVMQQQFSGDEVMSPVEIAQSLPNEYLQAHQSVAPSSSAYYIQNASFNEQAISEQRK